MSAKDDPVDTIWRGARRQIRDLDRALLNGRLKTTYTRIQSMPNDVRERFDRHGLGRRSAFRMEILYNKNKGSEISRLCQLYGSDKGELTRGDLHRFAWPTHTYADFYELLFEQKRDSIQLVLECGLGTNNPNIRSSMGVNVIPGASLRVWRDYFPCAEVIGVDIDSEILFTEDRIKTYYCDQTDSLSIDALKRAASLKPASVDIIIDDGLHEFSAGRAFLEGTFDLLKPDGVYVVEDLMMHDAKRYEHYFSLRTDELSYQIVNLFRPDSKLGDNSLLVVRKKPRGCAVT